MRSAPPRQISGRAGAAWAVDAVLDHGPDILARAEAGAIGKVSLLVDVATIGGVWFAGTMVAGLALLLTRPR
jgi:hypothetical protein